MTYNSHKNDVVFTGDPKYIGPGVWFSLHLMAKNATSPTLKVCFKHFLYSLQQEFSCPVCRSHIIDFLSKHPLEPYWTLIDSKGRDIGLFKYTWVFHNAVNKRLNKPAIDFESAMSIYYTDDASSTTCNGICADSH